MNKLEQQMLDLLKDLKQNYGVSGLKTEFEEECADFGDALIMKSLAAAAEIKYTVKTGGGSAASDMKQALEAGADFLAAPMIESPYAAEKFLKTAAKIFNGRAELYINIETKYALNYLDEISALNFKGIVFGRTDYAVSAAISDVNGSRVFETALKIASAAAKYKKEFIIGGAVTPASVPFLKKLPYLSKFETRKIIFNAADAFSSDIESGIEKAVLFEILYLKNNIENYNKNTSENTARLNILKQRLNAV